MMATIVPTCPVEIPRYKTIRRADRTENVEGRSKYYGRDGDGCDGRCRLGKMDSLVLPGCGTNRTLHLNLAAIKHT